MQSIIAIQHADDFMVNTCVPILAHSTYKAAAVVSEFQIFTLLLSMDVSSNCQVAL